MMAGKKKLCILFLILCILIIAKAINAGVQHMAIADAIYLYQRACIEANVEYTVTYLALKRAGINTIEELRGWDEESLLKLRDIGHAIVAEVQRKLRQAGGDGDADEIPPVPT